MSIQIVDAANPASRAEVRERLGDLVEQYRLIWADAGATEQEREQRKQAFSEQAKAFYHALTGYQMTDEEFSRDILS